MIRKEFNDYPFDKDKFRAVLIKARGDISQAKFSEDCSLSYAYLNKYTNGRFDEAPTIQTLKKIAAATKNVSFEELLEAAGYDPSKHKVGRSDKDAIKDYTASVFLSMANSPYDWKIESGSIKEGEPFEVLIETQDIKKWFFIPVLDEELTKDSVQEMLLSQSKFVPGSKVSFITDREEIFESLKKMEFPLLSLYVSAIKVKDREIVEEEQIVTSLKSDVTVIHKDRYLPYAMMKRNL